MTSHPLVPWHRSFPHLCSEETSSLTKACDGGAAQRAHVKYALKGLTPGLGKWYRCLTLAAEA